MGPRHTCRVIANRVSMRRTPCRLGGSSLLECSRRFRFRPRFWSVLCLVQQPASTLRRGRSEPGMQPIQGCIELHTLPFVWIREQAPLLPLTAGELADIDSQQPNPDPPSRQTRFQQRGCLLVGQMELSGWGE